MGSTTERIIVNQAGFLAAKMNPTTIKDYDSLSSPSYFTKCFVRQFGIKPGNSAEEKSAK